MKTRTLILIALLIGALSACKKEAVTPYTGTQSFEKAIHAPHNMVSGLYVVDSAAYANGQITGSPIIYTIKDCNNQTVSIEFTVGVTYRIELKAYAMPNAPILSVSYIRFNNQLNISRLSHAIGDFRIYTGECGIAFYNASEGLRP